MDEPVLPNADTENLFDSVMSEFSSRAKAVPLRSNEDGDTHSIEEEATKPYDLNIAPSGILEYKAYISRSESVDGDPRCTALLPPMRLANQGNGLVCVPLNPPVKPVRRKKPAVKEVKPQSRGDLNESRMSSELQELIDSAFSSEDKLKDDFLLDDEPGSPPPPHPTPEQDLEEDSGCPNYVNDLTRDSLDRASKKSQNSIDSGLEEGFRPAKSFTFTDEEDSRSLLGGNRAYRGGSGLHLDTVSLCSALSDEECLPDGWKGSKEWSKKGVYEDSISLSSFNSNELDSKSGFGRKINARARAKLLKKQATVHKDKVGALLDAAASNATDKIRKLRRPSMRLSKNKKNQNPTKKSGSTKPYDHNISSISAPTTNHVTGSASESEEIARKPLPPLHEASLAASRGHDHQTKFGQQVAIKSGYLKKQSGGKLKTWNERWFELKGDQLHYYKDKDGKLLSSIFLPGSKIATQSTRANENHKFSFEIYPGNDRPRMNNNHESYLLSASSQSDMDEWVKVIRRVILAPFGGGIFGQRLDETMRYDVASTRSTSGRSPRSPRRQAPIIVENCVEFIRANKGLTEEGLFRLPGQANEVKELQDAYDMGERPKFASTTDVHTVGSLLKGYLRELPEPVIPFERYQHLIAASKLSQSEEGDKQGSAADEHNKEKEEVIKMIKDQLNLLPQPNFDLLRYLCRFLDEVQRYSSQNKMDISNLAMVFGPNIMRAKQGDARIMMADATHVQHIMHQFIANHRFFFPDDDTYCGSTLQSIPDVAVDAYGRSMEEDMAMNGDTGIGTLTTTASPLGTLGQRHATDDSGTGSLGPTPENTNKRIPPVPSVPPPIRNKPSKPMRRKLSAQQVTGESLLPSSEGERKSYYDNVTGSSVTGTDGDSTKCISSPVSHGWRGSNDSSEVSCDQSSTTTGQASYYVNNRSTPNDSPRSSTHAVAGSICPPDSCHSSPAEDGSRYRAGLRARRPKPSRHMSQATDEESNTESVPPDDRAFSTLSSLQSDLHVDADSNLRIHHPRSSSYPLTQNASTGKRNDIATVSNEINRLSIESGSDGVSFSSIPLVPMRNHRKIKKESSSQTSESLNRVRNLPSERSSNVTATNTSVGSQDRTFSEMEAEINMLREELQKQRLEHEKRSRMLEEHYIMKMRTSASALASFTGSSVSYRAAPSVASHPHPSVASHPHPSVASAADEVPLSPSNSNLLRRTSFTDVSVLDSHEAAILRGDTPRDRTLSTDSQSDVKYREEVKRHAMTKIRLRNAERGLQQAEQRNMQLQKEMEDFFETFGGMLNNSQE